ncbi:hypothetical protein NKH84_29010 [Mesorhizobium sp. M0902]|uniref:hypothetical protein n=1 Tax=unclassified Mesorhizobium TaxID=325217 RepID=UPI003337BF0A
MSQSFDASRSLTALEQDNTVIAVIEMSKAKWLVAALVPGLKRQPLKKIDAVAPSLLKLLQRWRDEAGHTIKRIAVTCEAAGVGFWLARWLWARDIEAYAIHPASVAVSREHRRARLARGDKAPQVSGLTICWKRSQRPPPPLLLVWRASSTLYCVRARLGGMLRIPLAANPFRAERSGALRKARTGVSGALAGRVAAAAAPEIRRWRGSPSSAAIRRRQSQSFVHAA